MNARYQPAPAPQALVYCRVSTKGQEENGTSLDSQERECVAHATALGFTVGRITHEVYSGAELWDRPKLSRDRTDLKAGRFAALVCYATDRLSRDPIHLAILAEECERAGVALHFVSETFDDSDESALIRYVKGYSSKKEREKIHERSLRGSISGRLMARFTTWGRSCTATSGIKSMGYASSTSRRPQWCGASSRSSSKGAPITLSHECSMPT